MVSELEDKRPTKCVVHITFVATADDNEFGPAEDVCGQAWRQTIMARRVSSMHLPLDDLQGRQRKPVESARFHCAPSMAQLSPSLPISPEDFHNGMSTTPVFQRHGVVDDITRFRTPNWQSAPQELIPHEELLRLFRFAMEDLTRRQPRRVMLEADYGCAVGTRFEQHGRHRCLCNRPRCPTTPSKPSTPSLSLAVFERLQPSTNHGSLSTTSGWLQQRHSHQ